MSSAAVTTAGSGPVTVSKPSSVSRSATKVRAAGSSSSRRAPVTCGRSSISATSGPTCPVSASVLARPRRTTSGASGVSTAGGARAVASVSGPASRGSRRWSARSAPSARHSTSPSRAPGGPMLSATTSPPCAARSATAAPRARRSKELTSPGTPSRTSRRVSGSKRSEPSAGTHFTHTTIRTSPPSPDLAGVENATRVEELLHPLHEGERRAVLARRVAAVAEPHAVLARARSAERERLLHEHVARRLRGRTLGGVGEHERVQDADAGVTEEVHGEAALGGQRLAARDQPRERADRDGEVGAHGRRVGPQRRDRARGVLADRPRVAAAGEHERLAARTAEHVRRRRPRLGHAGLAAVHLDQQRRRLGEAEAAEAVEGRDRARVEELDRRHVDAEADQLRGRARRRAGVREAEPALPPGLRESGQGERQLGRDRERALGADHEPEEMVARRALARAVPEAQQLASYSHHGGRSPVLARAAVSDRAADAG